MDLRHQITMRMRELNVTAYRLGDCVPKASLYAYLDGKGELTASQVERLLEQLHGQVTWNAAAPVSKPPPTRYVADPVRTLARRLYAKYIKEVRGEVADGTWGVGERTIERRARKRMLADLGISEGFDKSGYWGTRHKWSRTPGFVERAKRLLGE